MFRTLSTFDFSTVICVAEHYCLRNTTCLHSKDVASGARGSGGITTGHLLINSSSSVSQNKHSFSKFLVQELVIPEPKSQDNFRSVLALDLDSMYDYCAQHTYTESKLIFSTINKERSNSCKPMPSSRAFISKA
jgi:hypothetical protein